MSSGSPKIVVLVRPDLDQEHVLADRAALAAARGVARDLGAEVTLLSWGGPQVDRAMRGMLAAGADRAVRLETLVHEDPIVLERLLADAVRELEADLVLCGEASASAGTTIAGYELAASLGWQLLNDCVDLRTAGQEKLLATQWSEFGDRTEAEAALPTVCLVRRTVARPLYVAVSREARYEDAPVDRLFQKVEGVATRVQAEYGQLEKTLIAPKIRVKKKKTAQSGAKKMTAAERRKALAGGRRTAAADQGAVEPAGPLSGDADEIAKKLVDFLVTKELWER